MASISSAGIGSGLDVTGLVSKLMAVESQPLNALNTKEASYQAKLSSYGSLKGALASVQSSALALKSTTLFKSMSATTGNSAVVSASANTAAAAGSYSIKLIQRAQQHVISSQALLEADGTTPLAISTDISAAAGKLKIELGTFTPQVGTAQVGTAQVGTAQVGTAQVGTAEVGTPESFPGAGDASPDYAAASPDYVAASPDYVAASPDYAAASSDYSASSFSTDSAKTPVTINIDATSSSLSEIRDAINAANTGVKANLVYVGTSGYKLSITSNSTGATNSIKITAMDANGAVLADNTGLAKLSFDPTKAAGAGKEFSVSTVAQDASFTVDGIGFTRATNSFSDAITGVTLSLGDSAGTTTTLTIAKDSASAKSAITSFVKTFNELNTSLRSMIAYNVQTGQKSVLTGDSGARSLQGALREIINYRPADSTGTARSLSDLGVALQRDGSLVFTSAKFDSALAASANDISTLFSSTSASSPGIAVHMHSTLESILSTTGLVASHTDGITSSIKNLGTQRSTMTRRLAQIEARYRKQFNALDSMVASMQQTSQYLTQQLANLPSTK